MKGNQQITVDICPTVDDAGAQRLCIALGWYLNDHPEVQLVVDRSIGETGFHTELRLVRNPVTKLNEEEVANYEKDIL